MPNWRNKINIKDYLTNDDSDESVLKVVTKLIPQLERIIKFEYIQLNKITDEIKKDNLDYSLSQLEGIVEEFKWIKEGIETDEDITELGYDGGWCGALNEYLNQLYDIGDSTVHYVSFTNNEKFLWVG